MKPDRKHFATLLLAIVAMAGCKKEEAPPPPPPAAPAPSISHLTLGKAVGADKRVADSKDDFGVRDTIYVSVATDGTGNGTHVRAVWTFGADTVNSDTQTLDLAGPAVTEFHITKSRPWPKGAYRVAVSIGEGPAQTREFTIK